MTVLERIKKMFEVKRKKEKVTWVLMRSFSTLGDYKNPDFLTDDSVN
jgi:hypothetical protein